MDTITFEIGDVTIQLVNGRVLIWDGIPEESVEADIDLPIEALRNALSTASMLRTE